MKTQPLERAAISAFANHASIDPSAAALLADTEGVTSADFSDHKLASVWNAIGVMIRDHRPPDLFAIEHMLGDQVPRKLLVELLVESADVRGASERLRTLRDAANRRRIAATLQSLIAMATDTSVPIDETIAEAQKALESMHQVIDPVASADVDVISLMDHLEQVQLGKREPVLETGLKELDAAIGGLQRTLTIIGSLPAVGKSSLVATLCKNLAMRGVKVGVFSLEDARDWLVRRWVAEESNIPLQVLSFKKLWATQLERANEAANCVHDYARNVVIDDRPGLSTGDIVASARTMLTKHECKAIIVDHLGEIRHQRSDRYDLDVSESLSQLRALAKTYGVPVVVACHIRRRDGLDAKGEPKLTDFANSSGIERMARVALALSRPQDDRLRVHVLKQTNGIAGVNVDLEFLGPSGTVRGLG